MGVYICVRIKNYSLYYDTSQLYFYISYKIVIHLIKNSGGQGRNLYAVSPSNGVLKHRLILPHPGATISLSIIIMSSGPKTPYPKRPFSGPVLTIVSINIEGITGVKEELLSTICKSTACDIICVQEIHRDQTMSTPSICGMKLVAIKHHRRYGSAIFTKPTKN